jgi:TctA family transporter
MKEFFILEGGYLVIGVFILAVSLFVGTRPFVAQGKQWKKGVSYTALVVAIFIIGHYLLTTYRMDTVEKRFKSGKAIICESRMIRKVAQSIIIDPKISSDWTLENHEFRSPNYTRPFHSARCIEY